MLKVSGCTQRRSGRGWLLGAMCWPMANSPVGYLCLVRVEPLARRTETADHGDIARLLVDVIVQQIQARVKLPVVEPLERIRATVIGASQFTVQVSGKTIYLPDVSVLLVHHAPVVARGPGTGRRHRGGGDRLSVRLVPGRLGHRLHPPHRLRFARRPASADAAGRPAKGERFHAIAVRRHRRSQPARRRALRRRRPAGAGTTVPLHHPARAGRRTRADQCAFDLDLEHGPNCGGELKIIAQPVIEKILTQLGLQGRAPSRPPARGHALQAAWRQGATCRRHP